MKSISGPYTLEHAIGYARAGRPDMLLMMIGDTMGREVAEVLVDLLKHPKKLQRQNRAKVLPNEAEAIRGHFAMIVRANPKKSPATLRDLLAPRIGLESETLRDILEKKKTYAAPDAVGEQKRKRSPPKPKR